MSKNELIAYFWHPLPPTEAAMLDPPRQLPPNLVLCQGSYITDLAKYIEVNLLRLDGPPRLAALAEENLNLIITKLNPEG